MLIYGVGFYAIRIPITGSTTKYLNRKQRVPVICETKPICCLLFYPFLCKCVPMLFLLVKIPDLFPEWSVDVPRTEGAHLCVGPEQNHHDKEADRPQLG